MMLRRLKDDVEKNLAPKEETIIEVELCMCMKRIEKLVMMCVFVSVGVCDIWDTASINQQE